MQINSGAFCDRYYIGLEVIHDSATAVVFEQEAGAIVTELIVPDVGEIERLSRIELLISGENHTGTSEPKFGVMLNYSDRVDPIRPADLIRSLPR